jgi:hypothetical protein
MTAPRPPGRIDFDTIKGVALSCIREIVLRWLPDGIEEGNEWVARNPKRNDRHRGSFKINLRTGRWADFATGDRGGDVVSLAAYLSDLSQAEAARQVAKMLGVSCER